MLGWVAELPKTLEACPKSNADWLLRTFPLNEKATRTLCSYEWRKWREPSKASLPAGLVYEPDCMAIGVARKEEPFDNQEDAPTDADLAAIEDDFLDALDAPPATVQLKAAIAPELPTLAFIDALPVPAQVPQDGSIQHGNSLRVMAEHLSGCDREPCRFRPGWFGPPALYPYPGGDVVGSPLDAAAALHSATKHSDSSESENLVASIGLGFEADARCAAAPDSLVVSALREAIRSAACQADAIIIAPVGNIRQDDVTTGMLYPAAFSSEELVCNGVPQGRPLVAAISGVNLQRRPLSSSRAYAPLMTIGGPFAHAGDPDEQLNPRTASSVAVAAAGPIISLAWWLRPDLDARGLLEQLAQAGSDTQPKVAGSKVIKACSTLAKLCKDPAAGRCIELAQLCPNNLAETDRDLPLLATIPLTPLPTSSSGLEPISCIGRGQRIEPSGPGE